mgnify:CR=1 FL=1|jgi:peptide/nickel transport system substrate-binding protein
MGSIYEPLVRWDAKREDFVGVLGTSWSRGEEGRLVRIGLRKDVRWHDGRPFCAADVKHSLEILRSAPGEREHPVAMRLMSRLDRVSYATDNEVELRFTKPLGPVLELLAAIPIRQAPKKAADPTESQPATGPPAAEDQVVGTGPFRFVQWWPGEKLVLGRWDGYWGRPASHRLVEFLVLTSLEGVVERMRNGALDLVLDLDARSYSLLGARLGKAAHPIMLEPAGYSLLAFNCRQAPLKDPRVRRALAKLIDRKKLVSGLPGPRPKLLDGPVWPYGPQWRAAQGTQLGHDPAGAAILLREAGFIMKGGRWHKDGQPFTLRVRTAQRSEGINRGLRALRDDLGRAGVTLVIEKRIWGELVRDLRKQSFQALLMSTPLLGPWSDLSDILSPGGNHFGYQSKDLETRLGKILDDVSPTRRLARERRLLQTIAKDAPFLVLQVPRSIGLARRPLLNPEITFNWFDLARLTEK